MAIQSSVVTDEWRRQAAETLRQLAKQCDRDENVATLSGILRQVGERLSGPSKISVDLKTNTALIDGNLIRLRPKLAEMLACLLPSGFKAYDHMILSMWGNDEPGDAWNTLKTYVTMLRRVLKGSGFYVKCHWGQGLELVYDGPEARHPGKR